MEAKSNSEPVEAPAIVIFGLDENQKPHGAWFAEFEVELAERAAFLMKLRALRVTTDEHRAAAAQMARGRLFSSGRAFAPFLKKPAYEALVAFDGAYDPAPPALPASGVPVPQSWEEIGVDSLVLANASPEADGWYEAVVIEDLGGGELLLRWRDWDAEPTFIRWANQLALLAAPALSKVG